MRSQLLFLLLSILLLFDFAPKIFAARAPAGSGKIKYCGKRFDQWRDRVCKWPGEAQPCVQLHHNAKERVKTKCCQTGCDIEEIKEVCCFTQACLDRCYPGKGYRVGSVYK